MIKNYNSGNYGLPTVGYYGGKYEKKGIIL